MTGLGTHILLDLYGCDPGRLNDLEFLRQMSLEGVRRSGATIVGEHFKQFEPQGISGVIIIAESHLSFHSWPEFSYIAMDYFTCGEHIDIDAAISYFNDCLSPDKVVKSRHDRGTDLAGMEWAIPQHVKDNMRNPWVTEYYCDGGDTDNMALGYQFAVEEELVRTRSDYQDILIVKNSVYGKMLFLDGYVMTTEKDEFVYHEMLSHIPLITHGRATDVLIIGGGDGGLLREVLRHPQVKRVDMVEIDSKVVEVSRNHLPTIGSAFDDERAGLYFEDGARFVREAESKYDVILVDSTDPVGPGTVLFEEEFFSSCKSALKPDGLFAAQALSAWVQGKAQKKLFANLRKVWSDVTPYLATIPTYPGALWTFVLGTQAPVDPSSFDRQYAKSLSKGCRYYNPGIHEAAFCLPNFLMERFDVVERRH